MSKTQRAHDGPHSGSLVGQLSFLAPVEKPPGLFYFPDFITSEEEDFLLSEFRKLDLRPMEYKSYTAKRNILSFHESTPEFLHPFIRRAEKSLRVTSGKVAQVLVTHYPTGAPIGWHRDAPMYEQLLGISLGSDCTMKLREMSGEEKFSFHLERRSAYVMSGPVRWRWEHHIPPVKVERYSLTFRTLVDP